VILVDINSAFLIQNFLRKLIVDDWALESIKCSGEGRKGGSSNSVNFSLCNAGGRIKIGVKALLRCCCWCSINYHYRNFRWGKRGNRYSWGPFILFALTLIPVVGAKSGVWLK